MQSLHGSLNTWRGWLGPHHLQEQSSSLFTEMSAIYHYSPRTITASYSYSVAPHPVFMINIAWGVNIAGGCTFVEGLKWGRPEMTSNGKEYLMGRGVAVCFVAVSSNSFLLFRLICFLRTWLCEICHKTEKSTSFLRVRNQILISTRWREVATHYPVVHEEL